jgi:hypothetical protein
LGRAEDGVNLRGGYQREIVGVAPFLASDHINGFWEIRLDKCWRSSAERGLCRQGVEHLEGGCERMMERSKQKGGCGWVGKKTIEFQSFKKQI